MNPSHEPHQVWLAWPLQSRPNLSQNNVRHYTIKSTDPQPLLIYFRSFKFLRFSHSCYEMLRFVLLHLGCYILTSYVDVLLHLRCVLLRLVVIPL